ncbi:MAG: Panacea domain-containing protein [Dehalococcoidales bacterium]|jgi:uncharacterized phage-associated protein
MATISYKFDRQKAIEAILYLVPKVGDPDIYGICKLLYFVDKVSLSNYGRFLFGGKYFAMKEGVTPSNVYDLLKEIANEPTDELRIEGNEIIVSREYNPDLFSKSDIACLDEIINIYGKPPYKKRWLDSHDAAWKKNWDKRGNKNSVIIPIEDIVEQLDDSQALLNHLANID